MHQNNKKILLIEPPFYRLFKGNYSLDRYPLSMGYLAGAVKSHTDWQILAYNADFCRDSQAANIRYLAGHGFDNYLKNLNDTSTPIWQNVRRTIQQYQPSVIGISVKSQNFTSGCIVAAIAKQIDPKITIIVGGPHPSMVGSEVMQNENIDIAVKGEGEITIVELLNAIENNQKFDKIKGIIYRDNSRIIENPPRDFIQNLDELPFPHENAPGVLKDYQDYPITAFKNIFAIRGCPNNCLFCESRKIWSRKVRFRSVDNVIAEIKMLWEKGLRRGLRFDDDTFGVTKPRIIELCRNLIQHCPGLTWECEIHVKLVDEDTIAMMKNAGCVSIQIGIESGNNDILKQIRKNITIEQAMTACKIIKKHGIMLQAFFIVGFPQETEQTLSDTVHAMEQTHCDHLVYSIFTPYPGTEAFTLCKEYGLIKDDFNISLYNHHSPANCFCKNIKPQRFRQLVEKIEKMVDRKNHRNNIKRALSFSSLQRIPELGLANSARKAIKILAGK